MLSGSAISPSLSQVSPIFIDVLSMNSKNSNSENNVTESSTTELHEELEGMVATVDTGARNLSSWDEYSHAPDRGRGRAGSTHPQSERTPPKIP